jgi:hypothetical protein
MKTLLILFLVLNTAALTVYVRADPDPGCTYYNNDGEGDPPPMEACVCETPGGDGR